MASRLLTDQQLDLLTNGIMNKIKEKESKIALQHSTFPKLNMAPIRKAAEAYLKEREKLMAVCAPIQPFMSDTYSAPDGIDLSDFDKWKSKVDAGYSRMKAGIRSNSDLGALRNEIKANILRNSISVADLDKMLAAIEKQYGI